MKSQKPDIPESFVTFNKRLFRRSDVERYKAELIAFNMGKSVVYPDPPAIESFIALEQFAAELGISRRTLARLVSEKNGGPDPRRKVGYKTDAA